MVWLDDEKLAHEMAIVVFCFETFRSKFIKIVIFARHTFSGNRNMTTKMIKREATSND